MLPVFFVTEQEGESRFLGASMDIDTDALMHGLGLWHLYITDPVQQRSAPIFSIKQSCPLYMVLVKRINQDHLNSVIQFDWTGQNYAKLLETPSIV